MNNKIYYSYIFPEKIHSFLSFVFLILCLLLIFIIPSTIVHLIIFLISICYFFYLGLSIKFFITKSIYSLFFAGFYLAMMILFPSQDSFFYHRKTIEIFNTFEFLKYSEFFYFFRLFVVSSLSLLSVQILNLEVILIYLMQKKYITISIGYPVLFAINSIFVIKEKFILYQLNHKLRHTKGWILPKLLFQFIVFILRFSESGALSFLARGLSEDKLYYYDFSLSNKRPDL